VSRLLPKSTPWTLIVDNTSPGAMALAATGDLSIVERVSNAAAQQLKSVGFNWVFAPVGDVNSDAANPVIGVRSFGDGEC